MPSMNPDGFANAQVGRGCGGGILGILFYFSLNTLKTFDIMTFLKLRAF